MVPPLAWSPGLTRYYNIVIMLSMITSIQKIIQIGSSDGVTLPAKELKRANIKRGDEVKVTVEIVGKHAESDELMREYNAFVEQYGQTLKNLADR